MKSVYEAEITGIGEDVPVIVEENVVIFFDEKAPKELHDVAVVHRNKGLSEDVAAGDTFTLNGHNFRVLYVGDTANSSMRDLGHFTVNFTGDTSETLPGTVYVEKGEIPELKVGGTFSFIRV